MRLRNLAAAWTVATVTLIAAALPLEREGAANGVAARVLFVCEHGSVKSVLAKALLGRAAARAGLRVHASARAITPDEAVPGRVRRSVRSDGLEIAAERPAGVTVDDVEGATIVVTFDVALPLAPGAASVRRWDGLPPLSRNYADGRDAIEARVEALVRELKAARSRSGAPQPE